MNWVADTPSKKRRVNLWDVCRCLQTSTEPLDRKSYLLPLTTWEESRRSEGLLTPCTRSTKVSREMFRKSTEIQSPGSLPTLRSKGTRVALISGSHQAPRLGLLLPGLSSPSKTMISKEPLKGQLWKEIKRSSTWPTKNQARNTSGQANTQRPNTQRPKQKLNRKMSNRRYPMTLMSRLSRTASMRGGNPQIASESLLTHCKRQRNWAPLPIKCRPIQSRTGNQSPTSLLLRPTKWSTMWQTQPKSTSILNNRKKMKTLRRWPTMKRTRGWHRIGEQTSNVSYRNSRISTMLSRRWKRWNNKNKWGCRWGKGLRIWTRCWTS
jgi:hypothetical protein